MKGPLVQTRLIEAVSAMQPRAVLFDLDGTLVDSARANYLSLKAAWAAQDQHLDEAWYLLHTGLSVIGLAKVWSGAHGRNLDATAAQNAFIASSISHAAQPCLYRDTVALLDRLHPTCPVGLVTNNFRPIVDAMLHAVPTLNVFSVIATVDLPNMRPKPAPDLYGYAAAQLTIAPSECIAIEDSDQAIEAALAANIRCIDVRTFRPVIPS